MKKKNLKSLSLNKNSISKLQFAGHIKGGTANANCTHGTCPSRGLNCPPSLDRCLPSLIDINGCMSENGCTGGSDQTMTCDIWGCPIEH